MTGPPQATPLVSTSPSHMAPRARKTRHEVRPRFSGYCYAAVPKKPESAGYCGGRGLCWGWF